MARRSTEYEAFETSERRLLRQEELILEVTEALAEALEREGITKTELARRLNRSKGFVSQIMAGGRNLTLRTVADVADALNCRLRVQTDRGRALRSTVFSREIDVLMQPHYPEAYRIVGQGLAKIRVAARPRVAA